MNNSLIASSEESDIALINQIHAGIQLELEKASIKALHLSTTTFNILYKAGFRTIYHVLYPTPEQLSQAVDVSEDIKQEIRERLLWAVDQSKRYFQQQVIQIRQGQLADQSAAEISSQMPVSQSAPLTAPDIDVLLDGLELFSRRVTNALMRHGVITLRLLLMSPPELLMQGIKNLGPKGLEEIEEVLAEWGWALPETADFHQVVLFRLLAAAFYKGFNHPLRLPALTNSVNNYSPTIVWEETQVAQAAAIHPYLTEIENGRYRFSLSPLTTTHTAPTQETPPTTTQLNLKTPDGKLLLSDIWQKWFASLERRRQEVLILRYGIFGDDFLTLEEVGQQWGLTRERVRQIETNALKQLKTVEQQPYWQPLHQLLTQEMQQTGGVLTPQQWETLLDEKTVWQTAQTRPFLLPLLGAVLEKHHYLAAFNILTTTDIKTDHLEKLGVLLKRILHQHKPQGLSAEELLSKTLPQMKDAFPPAMQQPAFILGAADLFEWVDKAINGRYRYLRKKRQPIHPIANSGWAGKPGTQLYEWELTLRQQFEKIAWIGQLPLTEAQFTELCHLVHTEAQEPNYFTGVMEGQPRLVPPAVFMTLMVFAARYSSQAADEFWRPYLRAVWQVDYTQAFMTRCRKRFVDVVPYMEQAFGFEFARQSEGELVAAIYRHALLPRYVQDDLANWLRTQWQDILQMSNAPDLLLAQLRQSKTLAYLPYRLQTFITHKETANTAVSLISNMAAAISLFVNDGESLEAINNLLADTPIQQELWREIAQVFDTSPNTPVRQTKPRLTWLWSLDDDEMILRVQNIILPADTQLLGEPDRLVWLDSPQADPLRATIERSVSPWHMDTGEIVVQDEILSEPDGPQAGQLVLLTDRDEEASRLDIPQLPSASIQFFRLTQQGAYGVPVEPAQVTDGVWLVLAAQPLTLTAEEEETFEPDALLPLPYPLAEQYRWAAQFTLHLPVTIKEGNRTRLTLAENSTLPTIGRPSLEGYHPIIGLSRQEQPTFASTQISITLEYGGEHLLKQASLWLQGQDGWRWQRPLTDMRQQGAVQLDGTTLHIHLPAILPNHANFYTAELRASLQPLLPAPLQFAVVPGLTVTPPADDRLYTPANPPSVTLYGLAEAAIVRRDGMQLDSLPDGSYRITWHDLRYEPRLLLRFDKVEIPLAWHVPHFMAWLEPKPTGPFLTVAELYQSTLHAIGTKTAVFETAVSEFKLMVAGQGVRSFRLKNGRYSSPIAQTQLYDMVHLAGVPHLLVKAQAGSETWTLFEVRQRPDLSQTRAEYDAREKMVKVFTGLKVEWVGNGRFIAESLSNPFAPKVELGQTTQLKTRHDLPAHLPEGVYVLRLELDGAMLLLDETAVQFTVGKVEEVTQTPLLIQEIRNGRLISPHQAEDFVLWWAEIAEKGQTALTPVTLYQLATLPTSALKNFDYPHLQTLWSPLAALKTVYDQPTKYGYLPAWILLTHPLILYTTKHKHQLRVYPVQAMRGGREGKGYGRWRLSTAENAPKELIFVQWQPISPTQVQVEAGLITDEAEVDWATLDLDDTYTLSCCEQCGKLLGAKSQTVPPHLEQEHLHGQQTAVLPNIVYGNSPLLAEVILERRGDSLREIYDEYPIKTPAAAAYLPEPSANLAHPPDPLKTVIREITQWGAKSNPQHFWAAAARLLADWRGNNHVSPAGQAIFALAALLRAAANHREQFYKLLKDAALAEKDVQTWLAIFNQTAPDHVQWGLTWAELLAQHTKIP